MPVYEYRCRDCSKKFALILTVSEYVKKKARCPKCSSRSVVRLIAPFFAQTSKKS